MVGRNQNVKLFIVVPKGHTQRWSDGKSEGRSFFRSSTCSSTCRVRNVANSDELTENYRPPLIELFLVFRQKALMNPLCSTCPAQQTHTVSDQLVNIVEPLAAKSTDIFVLVVTNPTLLTKQQHYYRALLYAYIVCAQAELQ